MKAIEIKQGSTRLGCIPDYLYWDLEFTEYDDTVCLEKVFQKSQYGDTVYLSGRTFEVSRKIVIPFGVSLVMQPGTIIRAKSIFTGNYVVEYNNSTEIDLIHTWHNGVEDRLTNLGIFGGTIDGNGAVSCLHTYNCHHFEVGNISLLNGVYGLVIDGSLTWEVICNNVYARAYVTGCQRGFSIAASDCHFSDCFSIDYTTGFYVNGAANRLTRCHVWGGVVGYPNSTPTLLNSINFDLQGGRNSLTDCYADTATIGYNCVGSKNRLIGCSAYNNYTWFHLDNVVYYKATGSNNYLIGCEGEATAPHTTIESGTFQKFGCLF